MKKLGVALLAFIFTFALFGADVLANAAPTKVFISGTTLTVQGYASPGSLVEIRDNNAVVGTTIADSTGYFSKYFSAFEQGINNISLSYRDNFGTISDTITRNVNVKSQTNTTAFFYLPPILNIASNQLNEGELQEVFGYTRPFSIVEITVDGGALILRPRADESGFYSISFSTSNYYTGQHIISARSIFESSSSPSANTKSFSVISEPQQIISRELLPPEFSLSSPLRASGSTTLEGNGPIGAQILFYEDGQTIGSTFVNSQGEWFFRYFATKNTNLEAVACYQDRCSEKSAIFKIIKIDGEDQCRVSFSLLNYRYFDVRPGEEVSVNLNAINARPPIKIEVDWGDGQTSSFTHDSTSSLNVSHIYDEVGQYNASVAILDDQNCSGDKYFSVEVNNPSFNSQMLWLIPVALTLVFTYLIKLRHREINEEVATENLDKI